jgi:SagB-type dehydrogenase family enzyme
MLTFELYHQISKFLLESVSSPIPKETWPKSWKTTYIKTYPRFKNIPLPKPEQFTRPANLQGLSSLLYYSVGEKDSEHGEGVGKRMYPSGGARFPLEFYLLAFKPIDTLASGVYHYNIDPHSLTHIKEITFDTELLQKIVMYDFAHTAQFAIITTAVFARSTPKYGERSYRFALLEAGAAMQNFGLCAAHLNIGSVNMGGLIDDTVERLLDIDGASESIVHSIFFG